MFVAVGIKETWQVVALLYVLICVIKYAFPAVLAEKMLRKFREGYSHCQRHLQS